MTSNRTSGIAFDPLKLMGGPPGSEVKDKENSAAKNVKAVRDVSLPKEIQRTEISFNGDGSTKQPVQNKGLRRQSSNVAGYFSTTPTAVANQNRFSMPVHTATSNSRFTVDLDNQSAELSRMMTMGTGQPKHLDGAGTGGSATER